MGIGQKIWQWNLKSAPVYWFAQGKYKKGLSIWTFWIAFWTILAFAISKPKNTNTIKERKYSNV